MKFSDQINALKRQFALTQDEAVLKVLRDALVEVAPENVDSAKWVAEQIGVVQERWHSLASLKETARRHLREHAGLVGSFVLARIKKTQMHRGVFAGDVVLVSIGAVVAPEMVIDRAAAPTGPESVYFRQYRLAYVPTDDFELINDEVAEDLPAPQKPMKIELKKFVANQRFSEETLMFDAEVWIDGKRAGTVSNQGHGGPNDARYTDPAMGERVREYLHSLPPDISTLDADGNLVSETGRIPSAYTLTEDFFFGMLSEQMMMKKEEARIQKWVMKHADKIRAAGMQPRKFVIRKRNGTETVTVVPFPNPCTAKAVEAEIARLTKQNKGATVTGGEAL